MPEIGRWLSCDPLGEDGGDNLYAFVVNDAVQFVDPDGASKYEVDSFGFHIHLEWNGPGSPAYGVEYNPKKNEWSVFRKGNHPYPGNARQDLLSRLKNPDEVGRMHAAITGSPNIGTAPESAKNVGKGLRHIRQGRVPGFGRSSSSSLAMGLALDVTASMIEEMGYVRFDRKPASCQYQRSYATWFGLGSCKDAYQCTCPSGYSVWLFGGLVPVSETTETVPHGSPPPEVECTALHGGGA